MNYNVLLLLTHSSLTSQLTYTCFVPPLNFLSMVQSLNPLSLFAPPPAYRMNLSKGPLVNSSSDDSSKSTYGKCGAGAWRMHQSYDPLEANHMRDAHALYNPR